VIEDKCEAIWIIALLLEKHFRELVPIKALLKQFGMGWLEK
jgi:hypothetical protein